MKQVEVVAAVIEDLNNGKILATQRGYGDFKGKWEFPGGKVEKGETREEALVREIKEEMNADINVDRYITTVESDYPTFHLTMHTYLCHLKDNKFDLLYHDNGELEHEDAKWLDNSNLESVDWLPADLEIVQKYLEIKNEKKVKKL